MSIEGRAAPNAERLCIVVHEAKNDKKRLPEHFKSGESRGPPILDFLAKSAIIPSTRRQKGYAWVSNQNNVGQEETIWKSAVRV
jgi:hypothetical protein